MKTRFKPWILMAISLGITCNFKVLGQESKVTINLNETSQQKGGSFASGSSKYFIELIGLADEKDILYSISSDDNGLQGIISTDNITPVPKNDAILFDITSLIASGNKSFTVKISYLGNAESPKYFESKKSFDYSIEVTDKPEDIRLETTSSSCYFYSKSMIQTTMGSGLGNHKKPFYVLVYDFEALNQGPKVFRHKDGTSTVSNNVWVGRNASFSFRNLGSGFNNLKHSISYRDYNLEDSELFSGFLLKEMGTPTAKPTTGGGDDLSHSGNQESLLDRDLSTKLKILDKEVTELISDSENNLIPLNQYSSILKFIRDNIVKCFSIGVENPEKFSSLFKNEQDQEIARSISYKLFVLESNTGLSHPPIRIKDHDALISKTEYFKDNVEVFEDYSDIEIPVLGGLKVDFSTGIVGSNLVDQSFVSVRTDPRIDSIRISEDEIRVDTVEMKKLIQENAENFKVGFGVFAHFYPRLTPYLNLSITTGFIVRDNLAFQFPVGLSALIGRKSRLVLSGGFTFGQRKVLSAKYQEGAPIEASDLENISDNQLTVSQTSKGFFLGLTYNFAKLRPK